jgi:hypothetical protein
MATACKLIGMGAVRGKQHSLHSGHLRLRVRSCPRKTLATHKLPPLGAPPPACGDPSLTGGTPQPAVAMQRYSTGPPLRESLIVVSEAA